MCRVPEIGTQTTIVTLGAGTSFNVPYSLSSFFLPNHRVTDNVFPKFYFPLHHHNASPTFSARYPRLGGG